MLNLKNEKIFEKRIYSNDCFYFEMVIKTVYNKVEK